MINFFLISIDFTERMRHTIPFIILKQNEVKEHIAL
jgi:hypothetical protein